MGRDAQTPNSNRSGSMKNSGVSAFTGPRQLLALAAMATPAGVAAFGIIGLMRGWDNAWLALTSGVVMLTLLVLLLRRDAFGAAISGGGIEEPRYRELFEQSPVAIWENDWSDVKREVDHLTAAGVDDIRSYLLEHRGMSHDV